MPNYYIKVWFDNGEIKVFDVKPLIKGGYFKMLKDPEVFKSASCDGYTVAWGPGQDLCPDDLYDLSIPVCGMEEITFVPSDVEKAYGSFCERLSEMDSNKDEVRRVDFIPEDTDLCSRYLSLLVCGNPPYIINEGTARFDMPEEDLEDLCALAGRFGLRLTKRSYLGIMLLNERAGRPSRDDDPFIPENEIFLDALEEVREKVLTLLPENWQTPITVKIPSNLSEDLSSDDTDSSDGIKEPIMDYIWRSLESFSVDRLAAYTSVFYDVPLTLARELCEHMMKLKNDGVQYERIAFA